MDTRTQTIRSTRSTQKLPVFVLAPTDATDAIEPALDAGADDVLLMRSPLMCSPPSCDGCSRAR